MADRHTDYPFTMSAFLAFVAIRSYRMSNPHLSVHEVIESLTKLKAGATGLAFGAGVKLDEALDDTCEWGDNPESLLLFVSQYIVDAEPWWLRHVPYGREKVKSMLGGDQLQCFREAGLFDETPDSTVIEWWDELAAQVRSGQEADRVTRSRLAERMSLEYEAARLQKLGVRRTPKWVALEDNTLGYDILSYDRVESGLQNRLIEVKSTVSDIVIMTRGEWNNAVTSPDRTVFHVWQFPDLELHEFSVAALATSIPTDSGNGEWRTTQIRVDIE